MSVSDTSDNLNAGAKPLKDAIAESLGLDDCDANFVWEFGQIQTGEKEETLVHIRKLAENS
jgi:hypothetical protein